MIAETKLELEAKIEALRKKAEEFERRGLWPQADRCRFLADYLTGALLEITSEKRKNP